VSKAPRKSERAAPPDSGWSTLPQPANIEAERCVLGAVLLDNKLIHQARQLLRNTTDFYLLAHQIIWRAMCRLADAGRPIDPVTLREELGADADAVGGPSYIAGLISEVPRLENLSGYAEIVSGKGAARDATVALNSGIHRILEGEEDPQRVIEDVTGKLLSARLSRSRGGFISMEDGGAAYLHRCELRMNGELPPAVDTDYYSLDYATGGMEGGDLWIIAARPSVGKTALGMNIAMNVASSTPLLKKGGVDVVHRQHVGFVSIEMSEEQLRNRIIQERTGIDFRKLRRGHLTKQEYQRVVEATMELALTPLLVDDSSYSIFDIVARAHEMRQREMLDLLVIDYLQLIETQDSNPERRGQNVAFISRELKKLAKQLGIPIIALSQLNREIEKRKNGRPQLSDLRESGAIEQDADVVLFPWRPHMQDYKNRFDPDGRAQPEPCFLIIGKQRNGPLCDIPMEYQRDRTLFRDPFVPEHDGQEPVLLEPPPDDEEGGHIN
jgi:replicative DNA helicase